MKKFVLFLLVIGLGVALLGCDLSVQKEIESEEQLFTLQALSSSALLNYNQIGVTETSYVPLAEVDEEEPIINDDVKDIDYYIEIMEMFLGNANLGVVTEDSDNPEYEFKTTYTVTSISGEEIVYTFYYNEFDLENEGEPLSETTEEGTQNRRFFFEDNDDSQAVKGLEGVLTYGENVYNIEGKKIVNAKMEIYRLRSFIDEDNYVVVNYQNDITDRDREKFFFKMVEDGEIVNEAKVMVFTRNRMTHVKLEFIEGENYANYIFNIRTQGDTQYIMINYEIKVNDELVESGNVRITAETDPDTGEIVYSYTTAPKNFGKEFQHTFRHGLENRPGNMIQKR